MEPISSTAALVANGPKQIAKTDVPEARSIVSTIRRRRITGQTAYETLILSGEHDGTMWTQCSPFGAALLHRLVVAALKSGRPLPEGGERE